MLRTILIRNQVLSDGVKKAIRCNITRCLSTELARRKHSNKSISNVIFRILSTTNKCAAPAQLWSIQIRHYADLPTHSKVNLPALSPTMENGSIVSWEKKEGDKLNEGDLLCEIETDKATMGFETPEEGYLAKIFIPAGTKGVPVGKLLCIIVENQADVAAFKDYKDYSEAAPASSPAPSSGAPAAPKPAPAPAPQQPAADQHSRIYASPMARRLAEIKNIRLGGAAAAAPAPVAAPAPGATFTDVPLSGMRETIARRLTAAKQTIPHYQLSMTVNVEKTLAMRKAVNDKLAAQKSDVKVGSISCVLYLSKNMKELAQKAKDNKLQPQDYQGGTVTVSNLGMFGITMFNAIINPPQSLILACGGLQEIVIPDKDSPQGFRVAKFVTLTASADHRVIDGAVGAQWMKALQENLEDPANMIL
ncbi:unnamed protein product [Leptidea sinapis]|uniref:Dihydrolipoamide acetyltransferase component of pyruvate dehydrogenase complex n=1 Tax=Leptidea sinapis TaxID=189913 RepID=A0A5E4Q6U4_9NEOP|nr:unnamed protein product [Leptidea sinapis]